MNPSPQNAVLVLINKKEPNKKKKTAGVCLRYLHHKIIAIQGVYFGSIYITASEDPALELPWMPDVIHLT